MRIRAQHRCVGDGVEMASLQSRYQLSIIGRTSMAKARHRSGGKTIRRNRREVPHLQTGYIVRFAQNAQAHRWGIGARIVEALGVCDLFVHEHFGHGAVDEDVDLQSCADLSVPPEWHPHPAILDDAPPHRIATSAMSPANFDPAVFRVMKGQLYPYPT